MFTKRGVSGCLHYSRFTPAKESKFVHLDQLATKRGIMAVAADEAPVKLEAVVKNALLAPRLGRPSFPPHQRL